ncbi:MAG: DUF3488 and transglutaminase-like domain-containing protein [Myxococcaceae bacterium]|nr:DUF3488 and transglutaminase-like domain-containing protein [Myxococcaceae bacterium]
MIGRRLPATLARDLTALVSYGAVAVSGSLPLPVLPLVPLAVVLSLLGVRPFGQRGAASVVVLLAVAAGLFGWSFFGSLDLVIAAVSFALVVVSHRLLADPTAQTTRQVLLTSLLVLAGGAAIVGDVTFAPFVVGFIATASWAMSRLVLDGPDGAPLPGVDTAPARRQVLVGTAFIFVLGVAFFVLFPRLSWSQSRRRATPGLAGGVTGMSDTVRLGGGGGIKSNPRVVFHATLDPDPQQEQLAAYWVGRHFTRFDGREWSAPSTAEPAAPRVLLPIARQPGLRLDVRQEIELTAAYDSRTLVALDTPALFARAATIGLKGMLPTTLVHVPGDQVYASLEGVQLAYTATSVDVRGSDHAEPTQQTLELPPVDPRLRALTTELLGPATSNLEKASRLERELTRRYAYTLELPGEVDDPLADFLFDRKAGHCEDFATALAIMLRLEGIPSRVTTGFVGGQRVGNRYHVRAGDAHAWTEAFIDGAWRRFDATPEDGRGASPPRWLATLTERYEELEEWWRKRVLDYSFQDQFQFVRGLVRPPPGAGRDEPPDASDEAVTPARWGPVALAVVGSIALAIALTRRRRVHVASSFLAAVEARLTAAGVDPREAPLEELSLRLAQRGHALSAPLARATRRYLEARFGNRPMGAEERRALLAGLERRPAARPG